MISLFCNHIFFSFSFLFFFFFFARIGSIKVFHFFVVFLSIGSLYRKRLAFRHFVLLTLLFMIVPTGKGTGRNRVIPFVQAHVGSLLCLQYKDLIVHVKQ